MTDPLSGKLVERLRVAEILRQRSGRPGEEAIGRFVTRTQGGVRHP